MRNNRIAMPLANKIAELFATDNPPMQRVPFQKFDPQNPSKLLDGVFVTVFDSDGNELEVCVRVWRTK